MSAAQGHDYECEIDNGAVGFDGMACLCADRLASDRLDPCCGAGSQEPSQAPSRDGIPLSERELGSGIEAGQVCNCGSPGTVGREPTAASDHAR